MNEKEMQKAALCGEPSYVWRAGQSRRLQMILRAVGEQPGPVAPREGSAPRLGRVLENGCGVGLYVEHLASYADMIIGMEFDFERAQEAQRRSTNILNAAGENVPFPAGSFDLIVSHEVLEHVHDDREAAQEMARCLRVGGRIVLFAPNRGYPFETHGIYWRGRYRFGNIPLVNYLPRSLRDRLAPHVRIYTARDLHKLFEGLPLRLIQRRIIFGAYDNIISRYPRLGAILRAFLQGLEKTPLQILGLSHFWVIEKVA